MDIFSIGICSGVCIVLLSIYIYLKRRMGKDAEKEHGLILYQVGRGPAAPSISPFPLKLETFFRMTNIQYQNDHTAKFSSKGKTPWMEYKGLAVADSQFCIDYFKENEGINLNSHLNKYQRSIARGMQKMIEENLYWSMCHVTFCSKDTQLLRKLMPYTGIKLWLMIKTLSIVIRIQMWGHGIGRHTAQEIRAIGLADLQALSDFLDTKPYMMGDQPSELDCVAFGMLAQILWHMPGTPHNTFMTENLKNLVEFCQMMKEQYWPDWDDCITHKTLL